jgi:lysophospholipase L1-like esterase
MCRDIVPAVLPYDSMNARAVLAALALVFAPGVARSDPPVAVEDAKPPAARAPVIVAAMGDSLTDARSKGGKFLDVLRERCPNSRFDNYGKGGEMVNQMRRRFADEIFAPGNPAYTHVIVFGGVNDLYSDLTAGRTPAKIEKDLGLMYEEAHRHGARVVAVTVSPWGGFRRFWNASRGAATLDVNKWILGERDAGAIDAAVDAYGLLSCGDPTRLCWKYTMPFKDGLHFGAPGHRLLGEALFDQVFVNCS